MSEGGEKYLQDTVIKLQKEVKRLTEELQVYKDRYAGAQNEITELKTIINNYRDGEEEK